MTATAPAVANIIALAVAPARQHAGAPLSARPFVKWAGGKRGLMGRLAPHFPRHFGRYFEPFLGGGAVFYHVDPAEALLGDLNGELVAAYHVIRDELPDLVAWLREQTHSQERFLELRALDPASLTPLQRAGRLIYLNRTCFNGLYRVNRGGRFNVSWGKYPDPLICDESNLRAVSARLRRATIVNRPYSDVVALAAAGDWVFFDPPYDGTYTGYTAAGFDLQAQIQLSETILELTDRGVKVVMTNSDTPMIRELYGRLTVHGIDAPRSLSCKASTRRPAAEVIVTNEGAFRTW